MGWRRSLQRVAEGPRRPTCSLHSSLDGDFLIPVFRLVSLPHHLHHLTSFPLRRETAHAQGFRSIRGCLHQSRGVHKCPPLQHPTRVVLTKGAPPPQYARRKGAAAPWRPRSFRFIQLVTVLQNHAAHLERKRSSRTSLHRGILLIKTDKQFRGGHSRLTFKQNEIYYM